jgi:two-component system OmpR family sensor kinase
MPTTPPIRYRFKPAGVVIAVLAFALTRFFVAEAMATSTSTVGFLLGQGPFLVAGLCITLVGVGLAISTVEPEYVGRVATWSILGVGLMVVVLASTLFDSALTGTASTPLDIRLISKILIGGLVGGTITGFAIARSRSHEAAISHQNQRLVLLNRLLRHHVLNKANIISGYSNSNADSPAFDTNILERSANHITETIEGVTELTQAQSRNDGPRMQSDLLTVVKEVIDDTAGSSNDQRIEVDIAPENTIFSTKGTERALCHLLTYLRDRIQSTEASLSISTVKTNGSLGLQFKSDASLLSPQDHSLLNSASLPDYDDPNVGFELPMARLLLEQAGASITTTEEPPAEWVDSITVWFPSRGASSRYNSRSLMRPPRELLLAATAGVAAGVVMGVFIQFAANQIAVIGALYASESAIVGWITHLFHSAVFGVVFAASCSIWIFDQWLESFWQYVALGALYSIVLWLVAASIVMPLWLTLAGSPTPVPSFRLWSLGGHLVWGVVLGALFWGLLSIDFRNNG